MNAPTARLGRSPFTGMRTKKKFNYQKKKTMKTLEIHNDLKKRLRTAAANGSVVAKDVLKALADGKTTTANANYFTSVRKRTLSEEGVSVYQIKITCCNKDIENPNFPDLGREDAQWLKHNRCEISALTFAEQFGLTGYSSDDITYFVSAIGCPSKIHLELISSEQSMEQAYNVENYPNVRQNTDLSCTLHHSCMRHEETARRAADFYHNFAGAKMLVAKGDDGLIYGRSIIWKNIDCVEYPQHSFSMIERVYCSYDFIYTMMMQWAEKNVDLRKRENSYTCTREFVTLREIEIEGDMLDKDTLLNLHLHINVPQLKWHKRGVPYMDTFHIICYYNEKIYISNHEIAQNTQIANCRNTCGSADRLNNICPVCGKVHNSYGLCEKCTRTYFVINDFGSFYTNKKGFTQYQGQSVLREMLHKGKPNKHFQAMLNANKLFI